MTNQRRNPASTKTGGEVSWLPTGNWQPLVAPVTLSEAKKEFYHWLKANEDSTEAEKADKAAEVFGRVQPDDTTAELEHWLRATEIGEVSESDPIRAITTDWPATNERRAYLIRLKVRGAITPEETAELSRLQSYASARGLLFASLPTEELEADLVKGLKATIARLEGENKQLKLHQWHGSVVKLAKEQGWNDQSEQPIADWLTGMLAEQPVVIEGKGQAVTEEWCESIGGLPGDEVPVEMAFTLWERGESERDCHDKSPHMHLVWSSVDSALFIETYDQHGKTLAAIELPVDATQENVLAILKSLGQKIEPRPTFTPPPKPELVLVRNRKGHEFYLIKGEPGTFSTHGFSSYGVGEIELIDEQTGEVIQ